MSFLVKFEVWECSDTVKKVLESFSITNNLAGTTRIALDYSKEGFSLTGVRESKQITKPLSRPKNSFKLKKLYIFLNLASQMFLHLPIQGRHILMLALGVSNSLHLMKNNLSKNL